MTDEIIPIIVPPTKRLHLEPDFRKQENPNQESLIQILTDGQLEHQNSSEPISLFPKNTSVSLRERKNILTIPAILHNSLT